MSRPILVIMSSGRGPLLLPVPPEMLGKVVVSDGDKTYKGRSYLPIPEPLPLYLARKVYFDERGKPALNKDPVALPHRIVLGVLRQLCPEWDIQSQYEAIASASISTSTASSGNRSFRSQEQVALKHQEQEHELGKERRSYPHEAVAAPSAPAPLDVYDKFVF
jgi:hypothetical protein